MARIDDYVNAKAISAEKLADRSPADLALAGGFRAIDETHLQIPFLDRIYRVKTPDFIFTDEADGEKAVPIQEEVLILHYLCANEIPEPVGKPVAYREIPGAAFYFSAFVKRAVDPLKNVFGQNPADLEGPAKALKGIKIEAGDVGYEFRPLPKIPIQMILWEGDDEFPADANILFDETIGKILSPEDVAWLSGMVVYRLMALSRQK